MRAHRLTSVRCGILLLSAHGGSRALVRENNPRSVFRQMTTLYPETLVAMDRRAQTTYATSRSVVSRALAFGARRFSSMATVAPMFSLRTLRLRANTG